MEVEGGKKRLWRSRMHWIMSAHSREAFSSAPGAARGDASRLMAPVTPSERLSAKLRALRGVSRVSSPPPPPAPIFAPALGGRGGRPSRPGGAAALLE